MEVLWRPPPLPPRGAGERPHSDCCSGEGLETDRPRMAPSVWKLFAHSLCRQCFVSDLFFPWLPISSFLSLWNHTDCGNLSKHSPPPNTGCCACCAYSVLHRVVCVLFFPPLTSFNAAPPGRACSACRSGLPTFSHLIVHGVFLLLSAARGGGWTMGGRGGI